MLSAKDASKIAKEVKEHQTPAYVWDTIKTAARNGFFSCDTWVDKNLAKDIAIDLVNHGYTSIISVDEKIHTDKANIVIYWRQTD